MGWRSEIRVALPGGVDCEGQGGEGRGEKRGGGIARALLVRPTIRPLVSTLTSAQSTSFCGHCLPHRATVGELWLPGARHRFSGHHERVRISRRQAEALLSTFNSLYDTSRDKDENPIKKLPNTFRPLRRILLRGMSTAYGLQPGAFPLIKTIVPDSVPNQPPEWKDEPAVMRDPKHIVKQIFDHPSVSWDSLYTDPNAKEKSRLPGGAPVLIGEPFYSKLAVNFSKSILESYKLLLPGETIVPAPIGIFNDATAVDAAQKRTMDVVNITVYNLHSHLRNREWGMTPLGILPKLTCGEREGDKRLHRSGQQALLQKALWEPLSKIHLNPICVTGIRGNPGKDGRVWIVPFLHTVMADLMGKAPLLGVLGSACGSCLATPEEMGFIPDSNEPLHFSYRTVSAVKSAVEERAHLDTLPAHEPEVRAAKARANAELKRLGIHNVMVSCVCAGWRWAKNVCPFSCQWE